MQTLKELSTICSICFLVAMLGCKPAPTKKSESVVTSQNNGPKYESSGEFVQYRELSSVPNKKPQTQFQIVTDSGIEFVNHFDRNNIARLIETGSGVCLGDYDRDGQVDVYLLSTDGPNRLYRGLGQFKFEDVTEACGVDGSVNGKDVWASGASFADVDNDGDLDLFVCNMAAPNLLYVNLGNGKFIERSKQAGLSFTGASKIGSFCDYDRDGDLDMYLLTYQDREPTRARTVTLKSGEIKAHPDSAQQIDFIDGHLIFLGDRDILYENDGKGNFVDVSKRAGLTGLDMGLSATWFDFDNDNWPDLYVANDFKGADKLYRNNQDGTFSDVIGTATNHTPWFSMGAAAGDLNNDGFEDLMVADMSGTSHYKQKVNMGEMSNSNWFLNYGHPRQYMRNAMYINTGTGRLLESAYMSGLESTDWTWAVRFADLDNDGWQDIYVTNGHARNTQDSDFAMTLKQKKKTLTKQQVVDLKRKLPPIEEANLAFRNRGNFQFDPVASDWNLDLVGVSHGIAFADFDRDGDLDMIVNNLNKEATVYRNESDTGNRLLVELRGDKSNFFGFGAKVEVWTGDSYQQRRLNPVSGYLSSDEPVVHFGLAEASTVDRMVVTWPNGNQQEFTNLAPNRLYRISENSETTPVQPDVPEPMFRQVADKVGLESKTFEAEYNDYLKEPLLPYQLSELGPGATWGDVNSDGFPDVFVGGPNPVSGNLFINKGGKEFAHKPGPWDSHFLMEDMGALFFDCDGDGDQDLYVVSGSNEFPENSPKLKDRLYLNDGNGNFSNSEPDALPDNRDSGSSVVAADFDRDGDLDLFVCSRSVPGKYALKPKCRLLRNDNGKFTNCISEVSTTLEEIGMLNAATWTDYDGDGWIDLMLAVDWGPVTLFRNEQGKLVDVTTKVGLGETLGWWHGIGCGDFDNDGDMDYVAGNHGLNTKYHCSAQKPHRLYYNDFDGNGKLDLVEAEYEGETEFPMRGRSCSSRCMPFIAEKFETFHEFALAPVDVIYDLDTKDVPNLTVNELRSMIIWNDGDDGFSMEPLPWLAQISPVFGTGVADFDGDGNLDLMLSQNFFGPQPETGFHDGGISQLLKGNGDRTFDLVWPRESGIIVPYDATSVALADFDQDGDVDSLFVCNQGPIQLFENTGGEKDDTISIRIQGAAQNQRAVGAQILLESDSHRRKFEVNLSSGYLGSSDQNITVPKSFANSLVAATVTWPDGTKSKHAPKVKGSEIVLRKHEHDDSGPAAD